MSLLLPYANIPATREPTRGGIRYIWLTSRAFIKRFYYGETAPNQYGEVTGALFNYRAWWMLANTPLDATLREDTSSTSPSYESNQTLQVTLNGWRVERRDLLERLQQSGDLAVLLFDNNNRYWMMGTEPGCRLTFSATTDGNTGRNRLDIEITARTRGPMPSVEAVQGKAWGENILGPLEPPITGTYTPPDYLADYPPDVCICLPAASPAYNPIPCDPCENCQPSSAEDVPYTPTAPLTATDVQAAIDQAVAQILSRTPGTLPIGYYYNGLRTTTTTLGVSRVEDRLFAWPFVIGGNVSINRLQHRIGTIGSAGSVFRMGLYADNGNTYPGSLLIDSGQLLGTINTVQTVNFTQVLCQGDFIWLAFIFGGGAVTQPSLTCYQSNGIANVLGTREDLSSNNLTAYEAVLAYGALPATYPLAANILANIPIPCVGARRSA